MRLSKSLKDKLMDVRLRDKLLAEGKLTQKELDTYLKGLGDDSSHATYTEQGERGHSVRSVESSLPTQ